MCVWLHLQMMMTLVRQKKNCTGVLGRAPTGGFGDTRGRASGAPCRCLLRGLVCLGGQGGVSIHLLCMRYCVDACGTEQYRIACQSCKEGRNLANYGRDVGQVVAVLANKIE